MILVVSFQNCSDKNDKLYHTLEKNFSDSIKLLKAEEFEYKYDGLTPQTSYFVDSKIKFLTLKHSGELTDIEEKVIFDADSIGVIYVRKEYYADSNGEYRDWNKHNDTIYIYDYKKRNISIYQNSNLIKNKVITKSSKQEQKFIYKVKNETEAEYNRR